MPSKLDNKAVVTFLTVTTFLVGCSGYQSLPSDWAKQIPGPYEGTHGSLKEVMAFEIGGTYTHHIWDGTNMITAEEGRWTVPSSRYEIVLTPASSFTQFYDPVSRTFSTNRNQFVSYTYWPLPEGKVFSKISAAPEFEFYLTRVGPGANATFNK